MLQKCKRKQQKVTKIRKNRADLSQRWRHHHHYQLTLPERVRFISFLCRPKSFARTSKGLRHFGHDPSVLNVMLVTETLVLETEQYSISSTFYEQLLCRYSLAKILRSQTIIREKLQKSLLYKNGHIKC